MPLAQPKAILTRRLLYRVLFFTRMLSQNKFDLFQNISSSHANLWVPQASSSAELKTEHFGGFSLPFGVRS